MELVPTHLKNTQDFLTRLHTVQPSQLRNMTFFSADVESLYTNISVPAAIKDIIEFADQHRDHLLLYGLGLGDIEEPLNIILNNSYFVYDQQIYKQLQGLFMGNRIAPLSATIRMWTFELKSIYTDLRISLVLYGRFYDDAGSVTTNKRKAQLMCNLLENQDDDGLLKLTLDYPDSKNKYIPFLNVEVKVDDDGSFNTRMFRKPQKKLLTLNYNSHHPGAVKAETVHNMFKTATEVSSNEENKVYSHKLVEQLLLNNSYSERVLHQIKNNKKKKKKKKAENTVTTLKVPFLSDQCTKEIRKAAQQCFLPLRIVATPGKKLGQTLTSSRPLDKPKCPRATNCQTCQCLVSGCCTTANVIYQITCSVSQCGEQYVGETYRPLHERFIEHLRSAKNPTAASYSNKPLAKHYTSKHTGMEPKLSLKILERANSTKNRKIREARLILNIKPQINDRQEQADLKQFLV